MVIMSAIITLNIFDYIQVSLKLPLPSRIYRLPLDQPNLRYMVCSIQKSDFQDLAFLIPKDGLISKILKIIVFVNKIEDAITVEKYLRSRLPERIRNRHQALVVI